MHQMPIKCHIFFAMCFIRSISRHVYVLKFNPICNILFSPSKDKCVREPFMLMFVLNRAFTKSDKKRVAQKRLVVSTAHAKYLPENQHEAKKREAFSLLQLESRHFSLAAINQFIISHRQEKGEPSAKFQIAFLP